MPESVENDSFHKFPLISIYTLHNMFIYLLYQLRTEKANTENCRFSRSRVFTVLLLTLDNEVHIKLYNNSYNSQHQMDYDHFQIYQSPKTIQNHK